MKFFSIEISIDILFLLFGLICILFGLIVGSRLQSNYYLMKSPDEFAQDKEATLKSRGVEKVDGLIQ